MDIPLVTVPPILIKLYKDLATTFDQERPEVPSQVLRVSNPNSYGLRPPEFLGWRQPFRVAPLPWPTSSAILDSIPTEIRDDIHASKTSKSIQYTFVLPSGRTIHLKLWSPASKKDIRSRIADIQSWFHFLDPLVSAECSQELTIFLYWTNHTKKFPISSVRSSKTTQILLVRGQHGTVASNMKTQEVGDRMSLDVVHVNSAFTYHCKKQNEICIFREEEWFRALIHESMHAFGMDFSNMNTTNLTKKLKKEAFPGILCTDLGMYEAYTETWAEILVILIRVFQSTHEKRPISSVKTTIQNCIYYEKCWAMSQATKVLRFYNLTYQDLLDGAMYQEDRVKVFSYYIIKAILMSHVEAFISWCYLKNPPHACFMFDPSPSTQKSSVNAFCTLIVDFAKDPAFLELMKQMEVHAYSDGRHKGVRSNMDGLTPSNISGDSLRMSLWG